MATGVMVDSEISKVELAALRDRRLVNVEDKARLYARAMTEADRASRALTEALLEAEQLNTISPRTVTDQVLADYVNQGIPAGAEALSHPLRMSLMAVRRRTGKAVDSRRNRGRR